MAYVPTVWVDKVTKLGPTNLNHLEQGVQAAAAVADAAVPAPAGLVAGDLPVWNGAAWVKASSLTTQRLNVYGVTLPKITTSPLAGGPPASPSDGDIWIATNVDTNGTRWQFQYDAAWATDANKWKFIGGPPIGAADPSDVQETVTGAWTRLNGGAVALSIARPGLYMFEGSCRVFMGGTNCTFDIGDEFNQPFNYVMITLGGGGSVNVATKVVRRYFSGIAAATTVHMMYYAQNASPFVSEKVLTATPIRIA